MNALEIKQLTKTYRNGVEALKGIDLTVECGDFFALLGANGAGKSTTIGIITSLVTKTSGEVSVYGHNIDTENIQAKNCIGLVPQEYNCNIFETCENILINQAGYYGIPVKRARKTALELLDKLGLAEKRNTPTRELSGGMKRRLMIARAMIHSPKMLILDEPTAGVDIEIRHAMWKYIKELNSEGTTIILTTHYLEEAENLCRNVGIIAKGQLVECGPMSKVMDKIHQQSFVLELVEPLASLPSCETIRLTQRSAQTLEVNAEKSTTINEIFEALNQCNIQVRSIRPKQNRLETLFLDVIQNA